MEQEQRAAPHGRYVRQLAGAGFSLEGGTERVSEPGEFCVFRGDETLLRTHNFGEAEALYKSLCKEHWEARLTSETPGERISSAWGLLDIDPNHRTANQVLEEDGTPADAKRLQQIKNRRRFAKAGRKAA